MAALGGLPSTAPTDQLSAWRTSSACQTQTMGKNLCIARSALARLDMAGNEVTPCRGALKECPDVGTSLLLNLRRLWAPCRE